MTGLSGFVHLTLVGLMVLYAYMINHQKAFVQSNTNTTLYLQT